MRVGKLVLFAGLFAIMACPMVAKADISDYFDLTGGVNSVDFENREVIIRGTAQNWAVINPLTTQLQANDLVVSVFRAQDLSLAGSNVAWTAGTDGSGKSYFAGYGVQRIAFAGFSFLQYSDPLWDPFGLLDVTAGETLRLYEKANDWQVDGPSLSLAASVATIATAADTPYAAFKIGGGYANLSLFNPAEGVAYAGLQDVAVAGSGAAADGLVFVPYSPSPFTSPQDISARASVKPNTTGALMTGTPTSPWMFESYGPMLFTAVPEPGTLAMWGGFLAIGAVVALRRRKS